MTEVKASRNGGGRRSRIGKVLRRKPRTGSRALRRRDLLSRFGPYLTRRRKARQLSIREFAENTGIAHSNIFQMECLRKNPRLTELVLLAKAFDESLGDFLKPVL